MSKIIAIIGLFFLFNYPQALQAQIQICEIKYGEKDLEKRPLKNSSLTDNPWQKLCYAIGVEHDDQGRPDQNKPIYACCRDAIGSEAIPGYLQLTQ